MKSVEILQFDIDKGLILVEKILDIHGGEGEGKQSISTGSDHNAKSE